MYDIKTCTRSSKSSKQTFIGKLVERNQSPKIKLAEHERCHFGGVRQERENLHVVMEMNQTLCIY